MRRTMLVAGLPLAAALLAVTTSCTTAAPPATPGVERIGSTLVHYRGPEIDAIVSYRFASLNEGSDWLFLDVALSGNTRTSVEVKRDKVFVRTPDGQTVPLATQTEFGQAYTQLAAALARADVAREPLDYFPARRPKGLDFLVAPGSGISLESVWVNDLDVAVGRLAFFLPSGVQNGPYELGIDLTESKVRIPFRLGEPSR
jgi:hypothetical protein